MRVEKSSFYFLIIVWFSSFSCSATYPVLLEKMIHLKKRIEYLIVCLKDSSCSSPEKIAAYFAAFVLVASIGGVTIAGLQRVSTMILERYVHKIITSEQEVIKVMAKDQELAQRIMGKDAQLNIMFLAIQAASIMAPEILKEYQKGELSYFKAVELLHGTASTAQETLQVLLKHSVPNKCMTHVSYCFV